MIEDCIEASYNEYNDSNHREMMNMCCKSAKTRQEGARYAQINRKEQHQSAGRCGATQISLPDGFLSAGHVSVGMIPLAFADL